MKTSYLLPHKFKKLGWVLFVFGLIIGAVVVFGGYDFDDKDVENADYVSLGYQKGVPMGSDLNKADDKKQVVVTFKKRNRAKRMRKGRKPRRILKKDPNEDDDDDDDDGLNTLLSDVVAEQKSRVRAKGVRAK